MQKIYLTFVKVLVVALQIVDGVNTAILSSSATPDCSINSLYSWQCDNGQCIQMHDLCDGIINCSDKSDESVEQCLHKPCPDYAFKCAYGGCITGNYRCNGIIDCKDGSDETRFLCNHTLNYAQEIRGSCWLSANMQCGTGECIGNEKACDGIRDCPDGSDETVELCSFLNCPAYSFRCGYGACVAGSAQCDGVQDCMDGSDESPGLCGYIGRNASTTTVAPATTRTTTRAPARTTTRAPATTTATRPTSSTPTTTRPTSSTPTTANRFCSANTLIRGISTRASCSYNKAAVHCYHSLRVGTKAEISCAPGYAMEARKDQNKTILVCDEDGEWNNSKFKCSPRCGELSEEQQKSVTKPWDVTIFRRSLTAIYQPMCSGVIVSPKIVVTAANCLESDVVDDDNAKSAHIFYNVIQGYYNFSYKEGDALSAIVHNISSVSIISKRTPFNVAVLVLVNYFQFSDLVKPICLPNADNKPSFLDDWRLNVGRAVTRDTSREYLEYIIGQIEHVDLGRRTMKTKYIRINHFLRDIKSEIKRYDYIL